MEWNGVSEAISVLGGSSQALLTCQSRAALWQSPGCQWEALVPGGLLICWAAPSGPCSAPLPAHECIHHLNENLPDRLGALSAEPSVKNWELECVGKWKWSRSSWQCCGWLAASLWESRLDQRPFHMALTWEWAASQSLIQSLLKPEPHMSKNSLQSSLHFKRKQLVLSCHDQSLTERVFLSPVPYVVSHCNSPISCR